MTPAQLQQMALRLCKLVYREGMVFVRGRTLGLLTWVKVRPATEVAYAQDPTAGH